MRSGLHRHLRTGAVAFVKEAAFYRKIETKSVSCKKDELGLEQ